MYICVSSENSPESRQNINRSSQSQSDHKTNTPVGRSKTMSTPDM